MTSKQWTARAEAYEEAADHLDMEWTNDAEERKQGNILSVTFRREGGKCRDRAEWREDSKRRAHENDV